MTTDSEKKEISELKRMGVGQVKTRELMRRLLEEKKEFFKKKEKEELLKLGKKLQKLERKLGNLPSPKTMNLPMQTRSKTKNKNFAGKLKNAYKKTRKNKHNNKKRKTYSKRKLGKRR